MSNLSSNTAFIIYSVIAVLTVVAISLEIFQAHIHAFINDINTEKGMRIVTAVSIVYTLTVGIAYVTMFYYGWQATLVGILVSSIIYAITLRARLMITIRITSRVLAKLAS